VKGEVMMMESGADIELVSAVREGSAEAYKVLYTRYSDRIYRYCLARLRDSELASDVLQETFLVLWQNASSFQGKSAVSTWLFGITTNKLRSLIRTEARIDSRDLQQVEHELAIEDASESTVQKADILAAVQRLPAEQQEAVILTFYADMTYNDIAEIQNVPVGTVKSRMFHARKSLKQILR